MKLDPFHEELIRTNRINSSNGVDTGNIKTMQRCVTAVNEANGWFDKDRTFGDDMALLHSEVSEAFEAFRDHGLDDVTKDDWKAAGETVAIAKPEGVGSELADVLVRLLDTAERYDVDLVAEFWRKLQYNATRGYRHGNRLV